MSSYGSLRVGSIVVSRLRNGVENELLAVFRDDMLTIRRIPARDYYTVANGYSEPATDADETVDVVEFRAPGRAVADRLDVIGVDAASALAWMDEFFSDRGGILSDPEFRSSLDDDIRAQFDREKAFRESLSASRWVDMLAATPEDPPGAFDRSLGNRMWLLGEIAYMDERYALRLVLLAFPDAEVVLDVTDINEGGNLDESELNSLASGAAQAISGMAGMHAPAVVLTEGRTDAEFLAAGLAVLYPHLTDLIRFLDYERRPEGGASALVRMVRAFAAAGIVNRVVAVFDNDTAAADGLRLIELASFPAQIQIIRYPTLDLAKEYPTLGPPTVQSPTGSVSLADVNGLAASIELYLGRDVLTQPDGTLCPVQWKSFISGMGQYQGEVANKDRIHEAFRAKYALALENPSRVEEQDWEGLRLILDSVRGAATSAFGGSTGPQS